MFSVPIESLRRKECSKLWYLVLLLLSNYIYYCDSFKLRHFSRGAHRVILLVFLFFPHLLCILKSSVKYEPSFTDTNRCMQICGYFCLFFNAWPKVTWQVHSEYGCWASGSFLRCHPHIDKGSVVSGNDGPTGSWKMWGLPWPCHLFVGWLWTIHSFIHQAFYGLSTRCSVLG